MTDNEIVLLRAREIVTQLSGVEMSEALEIILTAQQMLEEQVASTQVDSAFRTQMEQRLGLR